MKVTVILFAAMRDHVGQDQIELEVEDRATVQRARLALAEKYPSLEPLIRHSLFAVNTQYVSESTCLDESHEIACIPPVSGG